MEIHHYQQFCADEAKWVDGYGPDEDHIGWLTKHRDGTAHSASHTITSGSFSWVKTISEKKVKIEENCGTTGEHYGTETMVITAAANTKTLGAIEWDFPVSAMGVSFVTGSEHTGDYIEMIVGQHTPVGALTANTESSSAWIEQNYTAGAIVTYDTKVYTCILDTVSNESPTSGVYWRRGYPLSVNSTVLDYTAVGYYIQLDDTTNQNDVGRVVHIDKTNAVMYVQNEPANAYATNSLVRQSVKNIINWKIGKPWKYDLGDVKIGGSIIPTRVCVTVTYDNRHPTLEKEFIGIVEYVY